MKSLASGSGVRWRHRREYIRGDVRLRIILAPSSGRGRRAKRGGVGIPACEKPHREPTSAPSGHLHPKEGGSVPPSRIVISSESEKSFSFAVKKGCEERDHGKHRTPNDFIPLREPTSAPFGVPSSKGRREKSGMRNECGEAATLIPHFLETLPLISADFHPRNN